VIELRAVTVRGERAIRAFFPPSHTPAICAWLARRGPYTHAFFGVASRNGLGGTKRHLTALGALWIDLDTPPAGPAPIGPTPSVIVSSGRGEHWYWLLSSPLQVNTVAGQATAERLLRGLARRFGGDPGATDVSHLLRVPGTLNPKYDPPVQVVVSRLDLACRYHLEELFPYAAPAEPASPDLGENARARLYRPAPNGAIETMLSECGFLRWAEAFPAQVPEPLWYAAITNLAVFPNADPWIHALSAGHPKYTSRETEAKIAHARSFGHPHTCRTITALGAQACATCPWAGRVRAPSAIPWKLERALRHPDEHPSPSP